MRILHKAAAVLLAVSLCTGICTQTGAEQVQHNYPEPIASDKRNNDNLSFRRTRPVLIPGTDDNSYSVGSRCVRYLGWEPVDGAMLYQVYAKPKSRSEFELAAETFDTSFYAEYYEDTVYRVRAVSFTYDDEEIYSLYSKQVRYKIPDKRVTHKPYPIDGTALPTDYEMSESGEGIEAEADAAKEFAIPVPEEIPYKNGEEYAYHRESGFTNTRTDPVSVFSLDNDTASYTNIRRMITNGEDIPTDAVRIEEMLSYFDYDLPAPDGNIPFSITAEVSQCPWNDKARLLMAGIRTEDIPAEDRAASNLVFLVDVSGSMAGEDKLPLAVKSINSITASMSEGDTVSIVTYSGGERVILAGARGNQVNTVSRLSGMLAAEGMTNGEAGINTAYELAEKYYIEGGNNRIVLVTDGDLNVGVSSAEELTELISEKSGSGIYFSVLGFGSGNLKDDRLDALAAYGNGSYHYIDNEDEAQRALSREHGNIYTAAENVKVQLKFDPKAVKSYRLIGYDSRRLSDRDFDSKDAAAGNMGAGSQAVALYEFIPTQTGNTPKIGTLSLTWKRPDEKDTHKTTLSVNDTGKNTMSSRMGFACAVAELGLVLSDSDYKSEADISQAEKFAKASAGDDAAKKEFTALVHMLSADNEPAVLLWDMIPPDVTGVTCNGSRLNLNELAAWKKQMKATYVREYTEPLDIDGNSGDKVYTVRCKNTDENNTVTYISGGKGERDTWILSSGGRITVYKEA